MIKSRAAAIVMLFLSFAGGMTVLAAEASELRLMKIPMLEAYYTVGEYKSIQSEVTYCLAGDIPYTGEVKIGDTARYFENGYPVAYKGNGNRRQNLLCRVC